MMWLLLATTPKFIQDIIVQYIDYVLQYMLKVCQSVHSIYWFFSCNRCGSELAGMLLGVVPMFELKDFVWYRFDASSRRSATKCAHAEIRAYLRDEAI